MQQGNFIDVYLARHISGAYAHHQENWMLSCSIWFSAPSFWLGGGLERRCVGHVYGADGAVRNINTSFQQPLKSFNGVSYPVGSAVTFSLH